MGSNMGPHGNKGQILLSFSKSVLTKDSSEAEALGILEAEALFLNSIRILSCWSTANDVVDSQVSRGWIE